MEDCCVVCAEPLEWLGYGTCGHRDVCSICIARLRFVLNDKNCCICKQECSVVFMTKALGNFTRVVKDFKSLNDANLWYDNNTNAYFDDKGHFEMVKSMCRLSCQICEQRKDISEACRNFVEKGHVFNNLDQLRTHLLTAHKVQMCSLCLEGRKVFICEQKLYSKAQMDRHLSKGDSDVDGIGGIGGGFAGHPLCEFCQTRFYGDNELYQHMSVDHFKCHICQRLHPGQYEYFRNYDDLEAHFRHDHFLCEHPDCLAKKFIVFNSEMELKRHNALTHGGNMSKSQRKAALQIPVSFQYRRPIRDHRAAACNSETLEPTQPNIASYETFAVEPSGQANGSSQTGAAPYQKITGGFGTPCLEESAFPPLPGSKNSRRKGKQLMQGFAVSMASTLQARNGKTSTFTRQQISSNQWVPGQNRRCSEEVTVLHSAGDRFPSGLDRRDKFPVDATTSMHQTLKKSIIKTEIQNNLSTHSADEVRAANKTLIECIRLRLGNDRELFAMFKNLSTRFRNGEIDASVYYDYATSFGLQDLVPELARLCPDSVKQNDLLAAFVKGQKGKQSESSIHTTKVDVYEVDLKNSSASSSSALRPTEIGGTHAAKRGSESRYSRPWLEVLSTSGNALGMESKNNDVEFEDFPTVINGNSSDTNVWNCDICTLINRVEDSICAACGTRRTAAAKDSSSSDSVSAESIMPEPNGYGKKKKRASKFERARLGDDLLSLSLNSNHSQVDVGSPAAPTMQPMTGRGAWKNGGGKRLLALAQRNAIIESAWRK